MRILLTETTWTTMTLAKRLESQGFLVSCAGDAADALHMLAVLPGDAVIVDSDLPDMPARDLVLTIRAKWPEMPLFMFAETAGAFDHITALNLGADDLFLPTDDDLVIDQRIRAVVRRASGLASPLVEMGALLLNLSNRTLTCNGQPVRLTRYEYEIVESLALHQGQFVCRERLMAQLYAFDEGPTDKIIDVYISRIRTKLRRAGLVRDILRAVRNRGHMLDFEATELHAAA